MSWKKTAVCAVAVGTLVTSTVGSVLAYPRLRNAGKLGTGRVPGAVRKPNSDNFEVTPETVFCGAAVGTGVGFVVPTATSMVIHAIGFGVTGVTKGSIAAGIHSTIGNVAAGGVFASLQSLGVVGFSWTTIAGITILGTTTGVVAVVAVPAVYYWCRKVSYLMIVECCCDLHVCILYYWHCRETRILTQDQNLSSLSPVKLTGAILLSNLAILNIAKLSFISFFFVYTNFHLA